MSRENSQAEEFSSRKMPSWLSRLFVGAIFIWIGGFGIGALYLALNPPQGGKDVVSPFKPWDGDWKGEIVEINAMTGALLSRTTYEQTFRHIVASKDFRQEGHFQARDGDGDPQEEKSLNRCKFDGTLMRRRTIKRGGQVVFEHVGEGANGSIVWRRVIPGAAELFRETVEMDRYRVEGWGLYPDQPGGFVIMLGDFRRAEPRPTTAP